RADDLAASTRPPLPVLVRIGSVGFGADVYSAGLLIAGLPVPALAGWIAAIAGDLVWFAVLLATSIATAQVTDHSAGQLVVMVAVMVLAPRLVDRFSPPAAAERVERRGGSERVRAG